MERQGIKVLITIYQKIHKKYTSCKLNTNKKQYFLLSIRYENKTKNQEKHHVRCQV
jgi:hypothetical protein